VQGVTLELIPKVAIQIVNEFADLKVNVREVYERQAHLPFTDRAK
jgi:hypothetical protein